MFAIGHAATALLVKRRFPQARILWLLLSVQLMEILWVAFNYVGLERTTTESSVKSVSDVHLVFMPYSHSIASGLLLALLAWLVIAKGLRNKDLGLAVGGGIVSHLILDLVTHAPDIAIAPGVAEPMFGLGLYSTVPLLAFFIELAYGAFCWWIYRGGRALLLVIVIFNIANLSFLSAAIPGPEELLAGHPQILVTLIAVQIAVTLTLVGIFGARRSNLEIRGSEVR
jgi:membrane-bound metal-dependent hydrolase YbcI (DUF457 family)